jgi:hypothetical protein
MVGEKVIELVSVVQIQAQTMGDRYAQRVAARPLLTSTPLSHWFFERI